MSQKSIKWTWAEPFETNTKVELVSKFVVNENHFFDTQEVSSLTNLAVPSPSLTQPDRRRGSGDLLYTELFRCSVPNGTNQIAALLITAFLAWAFPLSNGKQIDNVALELKKILRFLDANNGGQPKATRVESNSDLIVCRHSHAYTRLFLSEI